MRLPARRKDDIGRLESAFNQMAARNAALEAELVRVAAEVTRVAREVVTDGKLGGQAQVPGVAGTWKDLTDSLNFMAELFQVDVTEVEISGELERPVVVRAVAGQVPPDSNGLPAMAEERWLEVPLVIERARVGCLRLVPPSGRSFSPTERSLLHDAADRAALAIRRAQLHDEEHLIAVELQRGLIPKSLPEVDGVELAAAYEVAGLSVQVGGDWNDAFEISDGGLGVVVGDVTGRGIRAASSMGQLRTLTRAFALGGEGHRAPGDALTLLNRHQLALGDEQLFTIVYAVIDPEHGTIAWANGGHPPPLLRGPAGSCTYLEGGNGLMGVEDVHLRDPSRGHRSGRGAGVLHRRTDRAAWRVARRRARAACDRRRGRPRRPTDALRARPRPPGRPG
ncbi:MAG TPA: SpoIIE family protein phosphatase [Solirubrobacteraceae bacterium]|nr:SpoIIE family protein phosphatase [Solirubrobacteraceae bacterium]